MFTPSLVKTPAPGGRHHGLRTPCSHAHGLCAGHYAGLRTPGYQRPVRPGEGTNCARLRQRAQRVHHGAADGGTVRCRHARTRRRGPGLVLPAPALGQLRHAGARQRAASSWAGTGALVPPPWPAGRRHPPHADAGRRLGHAGHRGAVHAGRHARVLPAVGAAQYPRPGQLVHRRAAAAAPAFPSIPAACGRVCAAVPAGRGGVWRGPGLPPVRRAFSGYAADARRARAAAHAAARPAAAGAPLPARAPAGAARAPAAGGRRRMPADGRHAGPPAAPVPAQPAPPAQESASLQALKDEVRRERAVALLLRTSRPIKRIAQSCGFLNDKSFIRAFRLWTGLSPSEFRKSARARPE